MDGELLNIRDRPTGKNILWATTDYVSCGPDFGEFCEIGIACIYESSRNYNRFRRN